MLGINRAQGDLDQQNLLVDQQRERQRFERDRAQDAAVIERRGVVNSSTRSTPTGRTPPASAVKPRLPTQGGGTNPNTGASNLTGSNIGLNNNNTPTVNTLPAAQGQRQFTNDEVLNQIQTSQNLDPRFSGLNDQVTQLFDRQLQQQEAGSNVNVIDGLIRDSATRVQQARTDQEKTNAALIKQLIDQVDIGLKGIGNDRR